MFQSPIVTIVLLITCVALLITLIVLCILSITYIRYIIRKMDDMSRVLYIMDKRHRRLETSLHDTDESIVSLSTSVVTLSSVLQKQSKPKLPKPDQVELITKTIMDLLSIEVGLSKNMRASRKDSVPTIIEKTINTYPEIDPEYITKKALSIIETYTSKE